MQKSFIERVFPKPSQPLLPQYGNATGYHDEPRKAGQGSLSSVGSASRSKSPARTLVVDSKLQPAPISASIIHHQDPFLAVDRAAQNLQRTIQSLLDFQADALSGRHAEGDDLSSQHSPASARSMTAASTRNLASSGVMPIRQPAMKKTTLKGTRRNIGKSMHEFASLKNEELRITENERLHRKTALEKIAALEAKRESVQHEITLRQQRISGSPSNSFRREARTIQDEIHELEGRLMELKAKHRHLVDQAEQVESSAASELSSYQGALTVVDRDIRNLLRHPPVRQGLSPRDLHQGQDMYSLRPERRTLELAKEQWSTELETLDQHRIDAETERDALLEGSKIWREAIKKIDGFERLIRSHMKTSSTPNQSLTTELLTSLDTTMQCLQQSLQKAEDNDWKLLICAIAPELESFRQARALLTPEDDVPQPITDISTNQVSHNETTDPMLHTDELDNDTPHTDLLNPPESHSIPSPPKSHHNGTSRSNSSSNESLKATLRNTESDPWAHHSTSSVMKSSTSKISSTRRKPQYSESEDDDPGPDFLLSH